MPTASVSLSEEDVEKLFSGAPQFFDRAEGHGTWAPHPSVAFPFDEELHIRDLTDHAQIEDPAWGCVTAWPHITRGGCEQYAEDGTLLPPAPVVEPSKRPHFYPRCREKPNMLSAQGLEKGTVGYQAALETGVSDTLQEEQFGFELLGSRAMAIVEARQRIMTGPADGLRQPSEPALLDQLIQCGMRYRAGKNSRRVKANDLYSALFTDILYPPSRILDRRDPEGLPTQIRQLLKILAAPNVWIDFSQVAWRIRLGQILWGGDGEMVQGPGVVRGGSAGVNDHVNGLGRHDEAVDERYWLLLQILLGCEMLIRLDAITEGDELGVESINAIEVRKFETTANDSVKWTLILARCWLENIEVVRGEPTPPSSVDPSPVLAQASPAKPATTQPHEEKTGSTGWLAALAETIKFDASQASADAPENSSSLGPSCETRPGYKVQGLNSLRQVNGLAHFARKLRWPGADVLSARILGIRQASTDDIAMEMSSRTPYFDTLAARSYSYSSSSVSPSFSAFRPDSPLRRHRQAEITLQPSGWVSRSYLSGLVMPGESLGHLLMASLLESDADALDVLGPVANLCGGFVYAGKSFWSTACVVGRVLAAGKGATECMGWVSSDVAPGDVGDGWINVKVEGLEGEAARTGKRARIWDKARLERESHILGRTKDVSVLATDFVVPCDGAYPQPPPEMSVQLDALKLSESTAGASVIPSHASTLLAMATPGARTTKPTSAVRACSSILAFRVEVVGSEMVEYRFALKRDVHFVTAHPCAPSHHVRLVRSSPSSPTIRQFDVSGNLSDNKTTCLTGHPLHKSYAYHVVHLSELLARYSTCSLQDLFEPSADSPGHQNTQPVTISVCRVLVVDCITGFARPSRSPPSPLSSWSSAASSRRNSERSDDCMPSVGSPSSPVLRRGGYFAHNWPKSGANGVEPVRGRAQGAQDKMHLESRRRQFGSDMEILVRALCAEKGWNAVVSRRRRGCLACAIREAGALNWNIVIRVD